MVTDAMRYLQPEMIREGWDVVYMWGRVEYGSWDNVIFGYG